MSVQVTALDEVVYITTVDDDVVRVTTRDNRMNPPIQFQDEGANVGTPGAASTIDFVGATVSLAIVGGKLTVTITSGAGTVTTFTAGNLTPLFTAAVANPTSAPALTFAQIVKAANLIFAGPATGADANPDFRALVAADISSFGQLLVNSATALVDAATIDLTAIKHTLATALGRTFTISYTGDDITLIITLSATSATFTFPATTLCVVNGTASGDNTMAFTGATSGDILVIAIKKVGSNYYAIGKNFGQ